MVIKEGDRVKIEYTGTLDDGTVFDSTQKKGGPVEIRVGAGDFLTGLEEALIGMGEGEEKTVSIPPDRAYGPHHSELVEKYTKEQLDLVDEPEVGRMITMTLPNGTQLMGWIQEVSDSGIIIDFNHIFAGETLNIDVKVVNVVS